MDIIEQLKQDLQSIETEFSELNKKKILYEYALTAILNSRGAPDPHGALFTVLRIAEIALSTATKQSQE